MSAKDLMEGVDYAKVEAWLLEDIMPIMKAASDKHLAVNEVIWGLIVSMHAFVHMQDLTSQHIQDIVQLFLEKMLGASVIMTSMSEMVEGEDVPETTKH